MRSIRTEDAVGHVICHDITRIIKDKEKEPVFRKGHVVREEDIPVLLSVGKEHLYVWEKEEGKLHENEAAAILEEICKGENLSGSDVKEGKIDLYAECDGLFKINKEKLYAVNSLGEMMIATQHGNIPVKKGDKLAGTRVIPLVIEEEKMRRAKETAGREPLLSVKPYRKQKAAIITTGSEVYHGRIQDTFTPVVVEKLEAYGIEVTGQEISDDDPDMTTGLIRKHLDAGADMILCTGGMSVDPDDKTPLAIRNSGADIITYGAPVLPGAMFLMAYTQEGVPVMGLPGCVMYSKKTIFDLVLPRVAAGEKLCKEDFYILGEGGLCLSCPVCTYPNCGFGKGW